MEQSLVRDAFLDPVYLDFRDEIASVLDPRTHDIDWLDREIWAGRVQIWGNNRACVLTEVRHFPTGAFEIHVLVGAGSAEIMVSQIMPEILNWKDEIGALFVTVSSRPAWVRLLKPLGFEVWQTEVRC